MDNSRHNLKLPHWAPIAAIIFAVLLASVVVVLIIAVFSQPSIPTDEYSTNSYDITELEETLSDSLAKAIEDNPYKDYKTELQETKFAGLTAEEFCASQGFSCSNIMSKKPTKISAINSNALNYYLDHDSVVIITVGPTTTVIYGALYGIPDYLTFTTNQKDFDDYGYLSRSEIFDHLTGSEPVYVLSTK